MVEAVAERLDGRLKDAMLSTHRLRKHLDSVRGYLLLAHGDYTDHLVNLLREELAAPASEISQMGLGRALAATLQARAGVSETAEGDEELWGRLRLVLEQRAGASGWDCLRVQYHVQAPLTTVLTPGAMAGYAAASGLLLRLKRVESALGSAWRLLKPNAAVLRSHFLRGGFSGDPDPEVQFVRRFAVLVQQATLIRSSMAHLVASVQTYLTFEVVEVEVRRRHRWTAPLVCQPYVTCGHESEAT